MNVTDDQNLGGNRVIRNYVRHDLMTDESLDGNRDLRMNDLLDAHSMDDDHRDVLVDHRMNVTDELKMVGNLLNRNCVRHDRNLDVNLDAMNPRVKLMDDLNRSCDRMSHDHLRYDRLKLRHRDTNRKVGMNLDGTMKIHRGCHPKTDDLMKGDLMKGDHLMACLMKI